MKKVMWVFLGVLALGLGIPLFLWNVLGEISGSKKPEVASKRPVKEFSISVAETEHELYPGGPKIQAWAFNGQVPGPTLRVTEGDLVRIHFTNKHISNHTLHFHGLNVPNEMDGVAYGHMSHLEGQARRDTHLRVHRGPGGNAHVPLSCKLSSAH